MEKFLINISPRDYQKEILETCKKENSLVVLPTGIGKTLIALMLSIIRMQEYPLEKILFLAPTRPLAEQHFTYFKLHLPELFAQMDLFTGKVNSKKRKEIWQRSDIVFSTPQCIANDLKKNLYDLKEVSLLIEDEAHRCVKNYSYTFVAKKYNEQSINSRILGLTASPGTDKKTIKIICDNLSIKNVEIRTRESEDVRSYLQELKFETIRVDFPKEFEEIRNLFKKIYDKKIDELKNRNLLYGPANKITLLETQRRIMNSIATGNKNFNLFHGASACAQAIKIQHAIELIETQTIYTLNNYLDNLIEQAKRSQSRAVKQLIAKPEFTQANLLAKNLAKNNIEHPKISHLKKIVQEKISKNQKEKIIIFSQYRNSVVKISKELNSINGISAKVFVGQTKKGETGLSQKEQKEIIDDFSQGKFNILCATSIGEEGLDIPEVNTVIFYEPVPSAIRKIQRTGRTARLIPGALVTLITKNTRDEWHYWSAHHKEKKMHKALNEIKNDLSEFGKINLYDKQKKLV